MPTAEEGWEDWAALGVFLVTGILLWLGLSLRRKGKGGSGLSKIPGPRQYPFGGVLNLLSVMDKKKMFPLMTRWREEYGPIFRVNLLFQEVVVLSSPAHLQKLATSTDLRHLSRPGGLEGHKPVAWFDGIFHSNGEKWKGRRKLVNPILSQKSSISYIPVFNEEGRQMVSRLHAHFQGGSISAAGAKTIMPIILTTALQSICKAAFGADVSGGELMYDPDTLRAAVSQFFEIGSKRAFSPWLRSQFLFRLHPLSRELDRVFRVTDDVVRHLEKKYEEEQELDRENVSIGSSMLRGLVQAGLDHRGIYEEVVTMMLGAYDNMSGVFHYLLFCLAVHPEIQERVRAEVDLVFGDEATCPSGDLNFEGVKRLQYLERCVMETLRRFPVTPGFGRKLEAPIRLDERFELPAGTVIFGDSKLLHMDPAIYPNPEKFDPDRFLPAEKDKRPPFSFIPFGGGPRICVGAKFAMMELVTVSARIVRHFVIRTSDRLEDVVVLPALSLVPEKLFNFVAEKRAGIPLPSEEG